MAININEHITIHYRLKGKICSQKLTIFKYYKRNPNTPQTTITIKEEIINHNARLNNFITEKDIIII